MYRGTIWGRTVRMSGSPLSMLVFRREFGGDFSDFVNETLQQLKAEDGKEIHPDPVDFLQIAWTMAKTYDDDLSDFEDWLDEFPDNAFDARLGLECLPEILDAITQEIIVTERPENEPDEDDETTDRLPPQWQPYQLILSLKRMGFSMDEIREMSMADVIAYTDIFYSKPKDEENKPKTKQVREATPADIRKLLS